MKSSGKGGLPLVPGRKGRRLLATNLGVPESKCKQIAKPLATGGVCAAIGGLAAKCLATKTLISIGVGSITASVAVTPVGWIIGGAVVAFGVGSATHIISKKLSTKGVYIEDFDGDLDDLAGLVADIVFRPVMAWGNLDWNPNKRKYILKKLDDWGYDADWSEQFLSKLKRGSDDILKHTIEIISQKGFGEKHIDKRITKSHLVYKAIELLETAFLDIDCGEESKQKKDAICNELKSNLRD